MKRSSRTKKQKRKRSNSMRNVAAGKVISNRKAQKRQEADMAIRRNLSQVELLDDEDMEEI